MITRRQLLSGAGALGAGLLVPACGGESGGLPAVDAEQTLFVQTASLEILAGADRWLAFGIRDLTNTPLDDAAVEIYVRRIPTAEGETADVVVGPVEASFSPAVDTGQGVYFLQTSITDPGLYDVVAVAGEDHGVASIQVVDPINSRVAVPGSEAVSAATATTDDDLGVFSICTQDPQCGMHEMSLDDALASGRPVVMMFATPQFCQTAVCGPSVQTLEAIRTGGDWGDTIFIHSEIYAEEPAGGGAAPSVPLVPAVDAWGLPSEPWMFTIDADGVIADRLDGPMPEPILRSMVEQLTA